MPGLGDLMREYERTHFPADRRLDVHGEGPATARERALHWIRSRAHESPGQELLLIIDRGGKRDRSASPTAREVTRMLDDLRGKLIDWWQPFAPGSVALRVAANPTMLPPSSGTGRAIGDGRTAETAGAARPPPDHDIPAGLLKPARRAAGLRLEREGLSARLLDVVLREVWIEAQAEAMERRISFAAALDELLSEEERRLLRE